MPASCCFTSSVCSTAWLLLNPPCSSPCFLLHLSSSSLSPSPASSLFTPGLYSGLFVYRSCFPASLLLLLLHLFLLFLLQPTPCSPAPSAPSITHSLLLTSPLLPSLCLSLPFSPLAHLSLSPCSSCHRAQCPPTRLTPLRTAVLSLFFFSL